MSAVASRAAGVLARVAADRRARRLYEEWVRPGDLCFDVGANAGGRARVLLSLGARVVAVEPQPECIAKLRRIRGLIVEPVAVGAETGWAELRLATASTIATMSKDWVDAGRRSGRFGEHDWRGSARVRVVTLDELIVCHGVPSFCKIDVEGYEPEVMAGLSSPVPVVAFEFVAEQPEATRRVVSRLSEIGRYRFNVSFGEEHELRWPDWREPNAVLKELASLDEAGLAWGDVYAAICA